jgi:hypothetical protein
VEELSWDLSEAFCLIASKRKAVVFFQISNSKAEKQPYLNLVFPRPSSLKKEQLP